MFKQSLQLSTLALIGLGCLILVVGSAAEDKVQKNIELTIENEKELTNVAGLVFDLGKAQQIGATTVAQTDKSTIVSISLAADTQQQFALATGRTADGQLLYSTIQEVNSISSSPGAYKLAACRDDAVDPNMQNQLSLIMNLLQVRSKLRNNFDARLKEQLQGELLEKLVRYETGFGLERTTPLSADLPPVELVDRLDRILHTLRKISPAE